MGENLILKNFSYRKKTNKQKKLLNYLKKINSIQWPQFLSSYKKNYKYSYNKNLIKKYYLFKNINIIGMGGSSLGTKAIYNFLIHKIKKNVNFFENLNLKNDSQAKGLNIIISKSGNTLETISNFNTCYNKSQKKYFYYRKK